MPPNNPFGVCAECGAQFEFERTYPVVTERTDDGVEVHSFCGDECLSEWRD